MITPIFSALNGTLTLTGVVFEVSFIFQSAFLLIKMSVGLFLGVLKVPE